jgi:hypothetical protein
MLEAINPIIIKSKSGLGAIPRYEVDNNDDILELIKNSMKFMEGTILKYGGILIRGCSIRSLSEFNKLSNIVSPNLFDYMNRSTPRTKLGGKIYTSTEYPADKYIPFHNENSYTNKWPNKLLFFCIIPTESGGETAIADSRRVLKNIDQEVVDIFNKKKVLYRRNYTQGLDLDWKEVFQTENKDEVEKYCKDNGIYYEWKTDSAVELITEQVCQATLEHSQTKEAVWFNQAHLFNISTLNAEDLNAVTNHIGKGNFPRNSYFGDGSSIPADYIKHIQDAYEKERIEFLWQKGDVMILDNILMAHSRNPYVGKRKIVVSMGE